MTYPIDTTYRAKALNDRVRFLIMHYTAANFKASMNALTGPNVSAHYLVPDPSDPTYLNAGFQGGRVFRLAEENKRAWHAGVSYWAGRTNLNDTSIGIEIVNLASSDQGKFTFPAYDPEQIAVVKQLAKDILARHPDITPTQVLGHSDIGPLRKSDPGPAFPWQALHEEGIGAWYDEARKQRYMLAFEKVLPTTADIIAKFKRYGYDTSFVSGQSGLKLLVRAFQSHFRPSRYDGVVDAETASVLYALVEKYF